MSVPALDATIPVGMRTRASRVPTAMINDDSTVQVYWRPGCHACSAMRLALAEAGVPVAWHNIWEDADARARVTSLAGGNETVPTVVVDGAVLVAVSPRRVLAEITRVAPQLVVSTRRWPPLRIVQWVVIIVLVVASEVVARGGHVVGSYGIDAVAVVVFVVLRRLRSRSHAERSGSVPGAS